MRPLRVLHVTPYSADAWAYGGIPRVADALARGLARRGHDVTVCTTDACDRSQRLDADRRRSRFRAWPDASTTSGVTVRVFPNLSNRLAYDWQLFLPVGLSAYLKRSAMAFDIAHLHACRDAMGAGRSPIVLFLGRLSPRKRVDVLVSAFARLRNSHARLVIAGNDMGAAAGAHSMTRAVGIDDRTVFTGLLHGRSRLEALADADVVVYPSEHEIFGLVPLEALLCGTPVVVANDSGCAEVLRGTGGGSIVPVGDPDALARAIDEVVDHPSRWRALATEAADRVRAFYAPDTVCAQLDDVYRELVAA